MALIYPPFEHWIWLIPAVMIGACIGSFLNVVIYRLPLGMSVNKPSRSFCPICKNQLSLWQNRYWGQSFRIDFLFCQLEDINPKGLTPITNSS